MPIRRGYHRERGEGEGESLLEHGEQGEQGEQDGPDYFDYETV